MVKCAKRCYDEFPTIVNQLKESSITYENTKLAYSQMDNKFAKSRLGIGWSSNLAQLAMSYYWTEQDENLYNNFVILSVVAQVIIDNSKREYEINGMDEIDRIQNMSCMQKTKTIITNNDKEKKVKCDYPKFMKYTKDIPYTKNGVELPFEIVRNNKKKVYDRINYDITCPMNWLEEILDEIEPSGTTNTIPTNEFFVKIEGKPNHRQMSKIRKLVDEYDTFVKTNKEQGNDVEKNIEKFQQLIDNVSKVKVNNLVTINRLVESALGLESNITGRPIDKSTSKFTRKMLNVLYKTNKEKFLNCFIFGEND